MCFPMFMWLIEFLPYLWVVTVPVYGSFCGIDLILRISILLFVYVIAGEMVPKSMVRNGILSFSTSDNVEWNIMSPNKINVLKKNLKQILCKYLLCNNSSKSRWPTYLKDS